ncbi:c-type cytochrome [uncultured Thiodictyon sp.]|uniref:c-type cytochrome n=1 Tax=uncultured Thiodictyon sp. TaxID=1846217 RepID=UPI0025DEF9E8|nr:c-type cytochrome [uncultured Thiodictyon sp.]
MNITKITRLSHIVLGLGILAYGTASAANGDKGLEGWEVYQSSCVLCHGKAGRGDGSLGQKLGMRPADFVERRSQLNEKSDLELAQEIKGDAGHLKGMPKWKDHYSDQQISDVVGYIRFLVRSPEPIVGNPTEGERLYTQYCVSCHGASGRGDGFLGALLGIAPADHGSANIKRRTNQELFNSVQTGKAKMPAWSGILDERQTVDVVAYIRLLPGTN